jgi:sirohydrochlorin cobaltochelatase
LVLWAHGGVERSGVAERLAAQLQTTGHYSDVVSCSSKGSPTLADALQGMAAEPMYLVPLLMAEGYTYRTVLPRLVAEAAQGRWIVQCAPVGVAPGLDAIVLAQALEACVARKFAPGETTLLLAAHGTRRDMKSGDAARQMARRIAAGQHFYDVCAAFLEQPPLVEAVLRSIAPRPCVVVGFFMDFGAHSADDIPRIIAAVHPDAADAGPVGARPGIAEIVQGLVQAAIAGAT